MDVAGVEDGVSCPLQVAPALGIMQGSASCRNVGSACMVWKCFQGTAAVHQRSWGSHRTLGLWWGCGFPEC